MLIVAVGKTAGPLLNLWHMVLIAVVGHSVGRGLVLVYTDCCAMGVTILVASRGSETSW